jgi:bifunctional UDP-N-acetylglucosamine pyrophosphorylase / glucosamine-1-phosphate N-acetyltransferase
MSQESDQVHDLLEKHNASIDPKAQRVGIVLAAGHGKRIRSETSKMLHEIWGKPSALRVANAAQTGLESPSQVVVVGIKGADVIRSTGSAPGRCFAYQENPVLGLPGGTGDAVRTALDTFEPVEQDRDIYIFPGDMGLLSGAVVDRFRSVFEGSDADMMLLTGRFSGPVESNYYGRILRVPATDVEGNPSGTDQDRVIEIRQHFDIIEQKDDEPYTVEFNGHTYAFSRQVLMESREIDTLTFAFKESTLRKYVRALTTDNAQGELQITDLVHLFNESGLVVRATISEKEEDILAFNLKSVWRQMESIARDRVYECLRDTITIVDEEDFFIADEVVEQILTLDEEGPLDIVIGKGAYIGPNVKLNRRVQIGDRSELTGNVVLGEDVHIGVGVQLSTYPNQELILENAVQILSRNILKGNLHIGAGSRIESGVIMTGSDDYPLRAGERVTVKGTSYLYGCRIDDGMDIEHSVIKCQHVRAVETADGSIQPVRYVQPEPEGLGSIGEL